MYNVKSNANPLVFQLSILALKLPPSYYQIGECNILNKYSVYVVSKNKGENEMKFRMIIFFLAFVVLVTGCTNGGNSASIHPTANSPIAHPTTSGPIIPHQLAPKMPNSSPKSPKIDPNMQIVKKSN
jgi:hypothetical protein